MLIANDFNKDEVTRKMADKEATRLFTLVYGDAEVSSSANVKLLPMDDFFTSTVKGAAIFFLSIVWVYVIARMVGRAVVRTFEDKNKTKNKRAKHE